jgi:hypothetical protein
MVYQSKISSSRLDYLIGQAMSACSWRGHTMGRWQKTRGGAYSRCLVCDAQATVNVDPLPNGIDICGSAVAMHCC